MLNLYLRMIENEDFGEKGNYKNKDGVSKEQIEKELSEAKTDKLEVSVKEQNSKIEETENEQRYQ